MRNTITLAAFLVTVAVIVPAGWHALGADIQTDGKRLRPLQESFVVDGTRVTLAVDRQVVMTGDTVRATLVAFSDSPRQIAVDLIALNSHNYEGSRVETPWIPFDHETIKLTAGPRGGAPVATMIKLGERPDQPALTDNFKIYITPHGKKPPRDEGSDHVDYDTGVSEGYAAAVAIDGWSGDNLRMSIEPEGRPTSDAPFTIAVRVKNTSGQRLNHAPGVSLTTEAALQGTEAASFDDAAVAIEPIETDVPESSEDGELGRGQTQVARFRVTPRKPGLRKMTFLASVSEFDDAPGPMTAGAKDARTFTLSETSPAVAAR
jgi:hypothetical protein